MRILHGEVLVEGTISAIDARKRSFVMYVAKLTYSSGEVETPKQRQQQHVKVGPETVLYRTSNPAHRLALGEIKTGVKVMAVGVYAGVGQPLPARAVAVVDGSTAPPATPPDGTVVSTPNTPPASVTPVKTPPPRPVTPTSPVLLMPEPQTQDGMTVGIRKVAYENGALAVYYDIKRDFPEGIPPETPEQKRQFGPGIRVFGPGGHLFTNWQQIYGDSMRWSGIDPRWGQVELEFDVPLPGTPAAAYGKARYVATFTDLPRPVKPNEPVQVKREVITEGGSKVRLDTITFRPKSVLTGDRDQISFDLHWEPAQPVPLSTARLNLNPAPDAGPAWLRSTNTGSSGREYRLNATDLPPAGVERINAAVQVDEDTPALKDAARFRRFRFRAPLPPAAAVAPLPDAAKAPGTDIAEDNGAHGQLDLGRLLRGRFSESRVWLQVMAGDAAVRNNPHVDGESQWFVRKVAWEDDAEAATTDGQVFYPLQFRSRPFWRSSGELAAASEHGRFIAVPARSDGKEKGDLGIDVEEKWIAHAVFHFTDVPVPAVGETAQPNQTLQDGEDALTLAIVRRFEDLDELKDFSAGSRESLRSANWKSGLALVFKRGVAMKNVEYEHVNLMRLDDDRGRDASGNVMYQIYNASGFQHMNGPWSTLLLRGVNTEAKSLDLEIVLDAVSKVKRKAHLVFKGVPAPKPAG